MAGPKSQPGCLGPKGLSGQRALHVNKQTSWGRASRCSQAAWGHLGLDTPVPASLQELWGVGPCLPFHVPSTRPGVAQLNDGLCRAWASLGRAVHPLCAPTSSTG